MRYFLRFGAGVLLAVLLPNLVYAGDPTHFVISGSGGTQAYDFNDYKIRFSTSGMTIIPKGYNGGDTWLAYGDFNKIRLGNASDGVDDIVDAKASIIYNSDYKELCLVGVSGQQFNIVVYSLSGIVLKSVEIGGDYTLSVADLHPGVYFAVASNSEQSINLKFVIK